MSYVLTRRNLLRAVGSVGMALPMLELTRSRRADAGGATTPKRYVFVYAGLSTGRDGAGGHLREIQAHHGVHGGSFQDSRNRFRPRMPQS